MTPRRPAVVAELGRPETPDEMADRKAAAAKERRSNQTVLNLVIATIASLGIVAFLVAVVVRPDSTSRPPVDYVAAAAAGDEAAPLLAPAVPADWYANDARIKTIAGVRTWSVGFVTGSTRFIGLDQGIGVDPATNPSWLSDAVDGRAATGSIRIAGLEWVVYDHRDDPDPGNYAYVLSTVLEGGVVVLHGTAPDDDFEVLAASVAAAGAAR